MAAAVVVVVHVPGDSAAQGANGRFRIEIYVFPLYGAPETLYPDIVKASCPTVHTDAYPVMNRGQVPFICLRG